MGPIRRLEDLRSIVKKGKTMTLAVASGDDPATIDAVARAVVEGYINAVLIGKKQKIFQLARDHSEEFADSVEILDIQDDEKTSEKAVQLIHDGKADMLMKGLIGTATFMRAILDKEVGIVQKGGLMSHVAVMEIPIYPKLLIVSDAAIIPNPTMDEKVKILQYAIEVAHSLGIEQPKAALVSAAEKINFRMQSSIDAAVIKAMAERHQITGAIVDGPLALDVSLSKESCKVKGLDSPINGEADILLFPNIETANTFYKSVILLSHGISASVAMGAQAPVVVSSRADDDDSKFYSIVLAAQMASHRLRKS